MKDITIICDPIAMGYLDTYSFVETYRKLLEMLDGNDRESFMDFYFVRSPCNVALLEFIDEDLKNDFLFQAIEMGLIPSMKEITWGQDNDEITHSASVPDLVKHLDLETRSKSAPPQKKRPLKDKKEKKIMCAQKSLDALQVKLLSTTNLLEINKLKDKIHRATLLLESVQHSV